MTPPAIHANMSDRAGQDHAEIDVVAEQSAVPRHVAIIMDGNGRWAASAGCRGSGASAGDRQHSPDHHAAADLGIKYLTFWAFSTENWRRPKRRDRRNPAHPGRGHRARNRGTPPPRGPASPHRQSGRARRRASGAVLDAIDLTRNNDRLILTLAFNYSGRQELLAAIRSLVASGPARGSTRRWSPPIFLPGILPDPDLIVRTSGEHRISNFLLWQSAYCGVLLHPYPLARLRARRPLRSGSRIRSA